MKIEIKSRWNGEILFEGEFDSLKLAVEAAVSSGARLDGASLADASLVDARLNSARLDGARLDGARLDGASLIGASLVDARLDGASLVDARLDGASLIDARLDGARLDGARLDRANLADASLDYASLVGARLDGANLVDARLGVKQLHMFRDDIWGILSNAPNEVPGLLKALENGQIDGSQYEGQCACLVGTIANVRGCKFNSMPDLRPNSSRPAEQWFMQIKKGDIPKTNKAAEMTHGWIKEWLEKMQTAFKKEIKK